MAKTVKKEAKGKALAMKKTTKKQPADKGAESTAKKGKKEAPANEKKKEKSGEAKPAKAESDATKQDDASVSNSVEPAMT